MKDAPAWVREGREMNETEWLAGQHLGWMLSFLITRSSDRRHLLFGCACCRHVWDLLPSNAAKCLVGLAERYADGEVTEAEFRAASDRAKFPELELQNGGQIAQEPHLSARVLHAMRGALLLAEPNFRKSHGAYGAAQETCKDRRSDYIPAANRPWGGKFALMQDQGLLADRVKLVRDIFGNPFRPASVDPRWLAASVLDLARVIYDERAFDRLPILADALMDAGCDTEEILNHCRGDGPHVRGCWVVDLILGKE
jgi:hypothetical protein